MTRDDVAAYESFLAADEAASVAHDFIWGKNEVTQQEASDAIWTIHNALRPLIAPRTCESCRVTLRLDEKIGERMGDPDFFCSDPHCPLVGAAPPPHGSDTRVPFAFFRNLRGQHRLGQATGWVWSGGVFWFRVCGWGFYRIRGKRPQLLRPGQPPRSLGPLFVRRWHDYWVWNFHRCDVCSWRFNLGKFGIGRYRRGF